MNKIKLLLISTIIILLALASNSCTDYESMYNDILLDNAQLQKQYDDLLAENEDLEQSIKDDYTSRTTYDDLHDRYSNLADDYEELESDYKSLESDYASLNSEFESIQTSYESLQAEHAILKKQTQPTNQQTTVSVSSQQSSSYAKTQNVGYNVTVTRTGDKYHTSSCRYVKNKTDTRTLSLSSAKSQGYTACKVCKP